MKPEQKHKPGLNYIELINLFWKTNLEHGFTGNESKLYFYLLHVCNSLGWKNPFKQSLRQINGGTEMSINSIKACQKRLVSSGLITVENGKPGNRFDYQNKTEYTILSVAKFDTDNNLPVSNSDTGADTAADTGADTAPDTINKLNKTKNNISVIFENFRQEYPGTKGGMKTELDNFLKKNKPETVQLLLPALRDEIIHKNKLQEAKQFCPEWKNLQTWINQRCWEQELPDIKLNGKNQPAILPTVKGMPR